MGAVTSTLERMVIDVAWTCHEWFYGSATGTGTCINPRFLAARRKTHAARRALSDCRLHSHLAPRHRDDLDDEGVTSLQVARHRHQKFCDHDDGRVTSLPATRHRHQKLCDHDDERATSHRHQQPRDQDEDVRMLLALPAVLPAASRVSTDDAADSDSDDWLPRHLREPPSCTSTPAPQRRPRRRATLCLPGEGHRPAVSCRQGDPEPQRPLRRSQRSVPHSTLQAMLFRCTAARNGCLSSKTTLPDVYPVRRMGRSWSVHNATANRAATL